MKEVDDDTGVFNFTRGNKIFELSNHLGNVLATISDKKVPVDDGTYAHNSSTGLLEKVNNTLDGVLDYYNADVVTANDYYPFGMEMPSRKYQQGSSKYRYSINGQEKESELNENITTALYWEYDSRIGRRWNIDPKMIIGPSPYVCFLNNPIVLVDIKGDTSEPITINDPRIVGANNKKVGEDYVAAQNGHDEQERSNSKLYFANREKEAIANSKKAAKVIAVIVAVTIDIFLTKGWATRTVLGTQLFSAFEHNKAQNPEGIEAQNDRSKKALANSLMGIGGGYVVNSLVGTFTRIVFSDLAAYGGTRTINPMDGDMNCAGCAIAGNATLNGYPASATIHDVTSTAVVARELNATWKTGMNVNSVTKIMEKYGDGTTGVIFGDRGSGMVGHFFNVVNKKGKIQFLDFQKSGSAIMNSSEMEGYKELWFLNGTIK